MDWRKQFETWSLGPAKAEKDKLDRVVADITVTLKSSPKLTNRNMRIFTQGSYANRVNVKQDSDVDICVLHDGVYYYDTPHGTTIRDFVDPFTEATYEFSVYKMEVFEALTAKYGAANTKWGNKAIDINNRTLDVDADVVPTFIYKDYRLKNANGGPVVGTALKANDGTLCINFPDHQHDNGVAKNNSTARKFKRQVRIQKNLRNFMEESNVPSAKPIKSFLLESLCWNAPDHCYNGNHYYDDFEKILEWLYAKTETDAEASSLLEVNGIQQLFGDHNSWTRDQVRNFIYEAWKRTH